MASSSQSPFQVNKLFIFSWLLQNYRSIVGVGKGHTCYLSEGGFVKEGTEIVDLPVQGKRGGETEHYSESQRETTI